MVESWSAGVEAVTAWHMPLLVGGYAWPPLEVLETTDFERTAGQELSRAVSQHCVHHAQCPVVIIREARESA